LLKRHVYEFYFRILRTTEIGFLKKLNSRITVNQLYYFWQTYPKIG